MSSDSLRNKTINGVAWSFFDTAGSLGITFIVGIILARLLSPEDYGLVGIIFIFTTIAFNIIDGGFSNALIRKNEVTEQDYSTMFYTNLAVSVILALALYFCSPGIAYFFHRQELIPLAKALSPILILNGLSFVQRTVLTKQINFKLQTIISITSSLISGVVGIALAFWGYGVWALIWQQLSRQIANTILLWVLSSWKPLMRFSTNSFKEMFGFGWRILLSNLLDSVWKQLNNVVIGRVYSPQTLGYYTRAEQYASIPSSTLTSVMQRVSFPVLSSIQDDKIRLKSAYRNLIKVIMCITTLLMFGLAATAKSVIIILIGSKWQDSIPLLQLLCFSMFMYPLHSLNLNMLQVAGRSDIYLKLEILKKFLAIMPILLGIFVGICSMLYGMIVINIVSFFLNAHYSGTMVNYSSLDQLKDIAPSLTISLLTALPMWLLSYLNISIYAVFLLQLIVGIIVAVSLHELFKLSEYVELKKVLMHYCISFIKRKN